MKADPSKLNSFIVVDTLDMLNQTVTLCLFINCKLSFQSVVLDVNTPDIMMLEFTNLLQTDELPSKFHSTLVSIFTDIQNAISLGNPPVDDAELLAWFSFSDEDLSTLFRKKEGKLDVLKKIAEKIRLSGKKKFVFSVYEKVLKHDPDCRMVEDYVTYCIRKNAFEKVADFIEFPLIHDDCSEELTLKLAHISLHFKQHELSKQLFTKVLDNDYGNVQALVGKAQCLYLMGSDEYQDFLLKACNFNRKIAVEAVTERFNFRKEGKISLFDVVSLKDAMDLADIPPEALEKKTSLSIPFRTESIQGSIFFVKEELLAWKSTMDALQIVTARFGNG